MSRVPAAHLYLAFHTKTAPVPNWRGNYGAQHECLVRQVSHTMLYLHSM